MVEVYRNLSLEDLPGEIWEDIGVIKNVDFGGDYQVSTKGRVKTLKGNKEKIRVINKRQVSKNYYALTITLWKNNKLILIAVSRLVAITYIPNPFNLPEVNHMNSNSLDNFVENLEWISRKGNMDHAYKYGGLAPNYEMHTKVIKDYLDLMSSDKIAKKHGITKKTVFDVLHKHNIKKRSYSEAQLMRFQEGKHTSCKKVDMFTIEGKYIKTFDSISEASKETNANITTISQCCNHTKWHKSAGGYKWEHSSKNKKI